MLGPIQPSPASASEGSSWGSRGTGEPQGLALVERRLLETNSSLVSGPGTPLWPWRDCPVPDPATARAYEGRGAEGKGLSAGLWMQHRSPLEGDA